MMDERSIPRKTLYVLQESQDKGETWNDVMSLAGFKSKRERVKTLTEYRDSDETCLYRMVKSVETVLSE